MGRTLLDKLWDEHVVVAGEDGPDLLFIDLHLLHEMTSPQAFAGLRAAGRSVRRPNLTMATEDHNVPTVGGAAAIVDPLSRLQLDLVRRNCADFGIPHHPMGAPGTGIVHVIGPEQGLSQPGMTLVCGDSHTATHGAFGALAFGIGTSEVEHVLATQTLWAQRPRSMQVVIGGRRGVGTTAKDIALRVVATIGSNGGAGAVIEYRGSVVAAMSMEERMTLCNMTIECGARAGFVAPDAVTLDYLFGRRHAPSGADWTAATEYWAGLRSDPEAVFDETVVIDATAVVPTATWGTIPAQSVPLDGVVPDPADVDDPIARDSMRGALEYMDLRPGTPMTEIGVDAVFIGSCTNGRLEDLRAAAAVLRGRRVASTVDAIVVPGSRAVADAAEREGLDEIFRNAGFGWRDPGCSMCTAMNPDALRSGVRSASTTNRNFQGRQGDGSRTHLVSPAVAAATAVVGRLTDPDSLATLSIAPTECEPAMPEPTATAAAGSRLHPILDHHRSIGAMIRHWAEQTPDAPGIAVEGAASRTFEQWYRRSSALAGGLQALLGLHPEESAQPRAVVGFVGKNAVLWGETMVASALLRVCAVPLNWRLSPREAAEIVADAGLGAIVAEAEFLPLLGYPAPLDGRTRLVVPGRAPVDFEAWLADAPPLTAEYDGQPEDIALMVYTSGTSGKPKGVELSNRAIAVNLSSPPPWDIRPGDVVMVPAPNFHLSGTGWIFYCLAVGAGSYHVLEIVPADVLDAFASGRVDHALTVPAVVQALVQTEGAGERTYPKLQTLIYGGAPMSPTIAAAARRIFGCGLVQSYGMTETCGPITFLDAADHEAGGPRLASAGRATDVVEMGVFDPISGRQLPTGEIGEVWTRSEMLLSGYRNRPDELAAVLRPDGWFRTGDVGYLDADGYLFLCDRAKDMIVSGGENVYPVEVENVLMEHPSVVEVAVIGVPDERWGETIKAVVVCRDVGAAPDAGELIAFCRERLAHYKCPTSVDFASGLPRNPSGKILKRRLREPFWEGRDRAIG